MKIPLSELLCNKTLPPSKELVNSIKEFGQRVPIQVVEVIEEEDKQFLVMDGERRVAALKLLGETEIEAIISDDISPPVLTLLGNLRRSQNPIAEGYAIQNLLDENWTKEDVVERLGIPLNKIYSLLRLIQLIPALQQKIALGKMSIEAGRIATNLTHEEQEELAQNDKISIKDVNLVKRHAQLELLDLETITIPRAHELDELLGALTILCTKLGESWERQKLIDAIEALESLRRK
ncbi:MAG: ParB/RepB/Spo0J family partition protein [Deltaproteobacteria bacterium]|nr:ParB/RepB/Spo0J family partition protein [Deltaproteobacteria bacterium]